MFDVAVTGQRGRIVIRSDPNVVVFVKIMSSISRKPSKIERSLVILLSVNRKSYIGCLSLPWLSVSPNYRKGLKLPSAGDVVSMTSERYRVLYFVI